MAKPSLLLEFLEFLRYRKRYWLIPVVVCLLFISALFVITESSVIAPFIYALF